MDRPRRRILKSVALAPFAVLWETRSVAEPPANPVIQVRARRFTYTPADIRVPFGEDTTIALATDDVPMGFSIPDLGVRATILPGLPTSVVVHPARRGTFVFLCDVFCGNGHEDMSGTITVF